MFAVSDIFLPGPNCPESASSASMRVLNEPYDAVARTPGWYATLRESRLIVPPKFVGPIDEAEPGLRSKSTPAMNWLGKNAQEWCVGSLVSLNGMPSACIVYIPSLKPRKNVLLSPSPTPFGFTLNVPGALLSNSLKSATGDA